MNLKQRQIDLFLKQMGVFASNPDIKFDPDFVYARLTCFGPINMKCHEDLINRYNNDNNINVYYHKKFGDNFLMLDYGSFDLANAIKLYIPFKEENKSACTQMLFDYIKNNHIAHQSKVAKRARHDGVVVRVGSLEDAQKIINFVHVMPTLQQNLEPVNPFLIDDNGIGMAMDGHYSYNDVVSNSVADFVSSVIKSGNTNNLSIENFANYIAEKAKTTTDSDLVRIYDLIQINFKGITRFSDLSDYVTRKKSVGQIFDDKNLTKEELNDLMVKEGFIHDAVVTQFHKYGYDRTIIAIKKYCYGDPNYFTRDENARFGLINNINPTQMMDIIKNSLKFIYQTTNYSESNIAESYLDAIGLQKDIDDNKELA